MWPIIKKRLTDVTLLEKWPKFRIFWYMAYAYAYCVKNVFMITYPYHISFIVCHDFGTHCKNTLHWLEHYSIPWSQDTWKLKPSLPIKTCRFDTRIDYIFANNNLLSKYEVQKVLHVDNTASNHNMVMTTFAKCK